MSWEKLKGRTIENIFIDKAKENLWVKCVEEDFILSTEGDCCSKTWIEHISVPWREAGPIVEVKEIELGEGAATRQDCDQLYVLRIILQTGGSLDVEFRNSSNGYYGGQMFPRYDIPDWVANIEWDLVEESF